MTVNTYSTPGIFAYTVPTGMSFVRIECWGAQGGSFGGAGGGYGGYVTGLYIVAPGTTLDITVGGTTANNAGGTNGGGNGIGSGANTSSGGGGFSSVRLNSFALSATIIAAGGGGGDGSRPSPSVQNGGGTGGGTGGAHGQFYGSGAGGTQTSGATPGQGGNGTASTYNGGGGGGGYPYSGWGGYGSSYGGGGGGGGAGFLSSVLLNAAALNGANAGNGQVKITAVNTAPYAPTATAPAANAAVIASAPITFSWVFADPDPGDFQTRVDIRYKANSGDAWTTLTTIATTTFSWVLAANTWTAGHTYEYQMSVFDCGSAQSPWSASRFATTTSTFAAPAITAPAAGANEWTSPVELDWTLPSGFTLADAYRVERSETSDGSGIVYYDSGVVVSGVQHALIPLDSVQGRTDWLRVTFRYGGLWSAWASVNIVGQLAPPQVPIVTAYQP